MCYDNVILRYSEGKLKNMKIYVMKMAFQINEVKMDYLEKNSVGKIV